MPSQRRAYIAGIVGRLRKLKNEKIVFLDPDTGIEPGDAGPEHVTKADAAEVWSALGPGDLLVIYQHADRTTWWREGRAKTMSSAYGDAPVYVIVGKGVASDVAMLYCVKAQTSNTVTRTKNGYVMVHDDADVSEKGR